MPLIEAFVVLVLVSMALCQLLFREYRKNRALRRLLTAFWAPKKDNL